MTTNPPVNASSFASDVDEIAYYILRGQLALPSRMRRELRMSLVREGFVFSARTLGQKHHKVTAVDFPAGWTVQNMGEQTYGRCLYLLDPSKNRRAMIRICHNQTAFETDMKAFLYHSYRIFDCTPTGRFLNHNDSREGASKGIFLTIRGRPSTPIGVVGEKTNMPTLRYMAQRLLDHRYPDWRQPDAYWKDTNS